MKRVSSALVCIMLLILLSGCGTMAGWVGIASKKFVEEKMVTLQEQVQIEVDQSRSEMAQMRTVMDGFATTASMLEGALISFEQTVKTTEELSQLAGILEEKLVNLPKETIQQLVTILQQYLDSR